MGQRVTPAMVEEIFDNPSSVALTPFITAASLIVDDLAGGCGSSLGVPHLVEIERWLSAHLASIHSDSRGEEEVKIGDASIKFEGDSSGGLGLDFTRYGSQVKILDTSGCLASLGKPRAKFSVISRGELP